MDKTITFKTTQQYTDDMEKEFYDELNNCIPKKQLKLIQDDLNIPLSTIKNHIYDFSHIDDIQHLIDLKKDCTDWIINNQEYHLDKQLFSQILSAYIVLPQMNIDKIYTKWTNLVYILHSNLSCKLEQEIQKQLSELNKKSIPNNTVSFFNSKNEKIATISKDGIFSFKMEPNDENTKDFLKTLQTLGIKIKQINYFEV